MKQNKYESTIEKMMCRQQEVCGFCSGILDELFNDGSPIIENETDKALTLPIEKLNFVIEELNAIKSNVEILSILDNEEYLNQ